ncbi:MAG: hypothetical protein OEY91_08925 [Nitrospirota bacterium]|nr:hypothetical protein [Nitrospirota bacterium]
MIYQTILLVSVCLTHVFLASCGSPVHLSIYQTETEWVDLREWPSGYPMLTNLSHPADLEAAQLRELLQNIQYRQSALFSFHMGKLHSTFSEYQLTLLASELPKAFGQALPEEVIAFRVRNEQTGHLYTKGFGFIHEQELHLVIQELQQPDFYSPNNQTGPPTVRWEFTPQTGQRRFAPRPGSTHDFPHWIITPISKRSSHGLS